MFSETVIVSELDIGDTILFCASPYVIIGITKLHSSFILTCYQQRTNETAELDFVHNATRIRVKNGAVRSCSPCYDSDCDCIYDQVR